MTGTNKKCAADTVQHVLEDHRAGQLNTPTVDDDIEEWLRDRLPSLVTWKGWQRIDAHERALGAPQRRPLVKVVDIDAMTAIAAS